MLGRGAGDVIFWGLVWFFASAPDGSARKPRLIDSGSPEIKEKIDICFAEPS
jgi:hypothetical protein